ncbi:hypothetical protein HPB52_006342 [Rhipicephalus sanguineus]|uniref:Peptidase M13 C-terminal domain-containing protein n=1 Tax=Rhipicephalus sanguineus TaxID=34632 RepID=A0A9D4PHM9_RHISA|nr:hypothetical protein HPB52_006342 [Rhipicephalus sanguineus]
MATKALEIHEHKTLFRQSLGILALVVVLSFVVFVLRPMKFLKGPFSFGADQPPVVIGMSVEAALFRYRCDQASEDAREAIDYYVDPCEDFHAYACGRLRGKDRAQLEDDRSRLQRVLFQLSLLNDSNHVAVQAAVLFKSCLNMPLSLEILLRENMLQFLNVTKLSAKTMLEGKETLLPGLTSNISTCLSRSSQNRLLDKLLDHIALQTVAFQVALRASKSYASAWTRIENAADAPAWKQTYFVKYCQRLCSKDASRSSTAALDAAIVCNSVVMNSREFAQLFRCERGDPMVPSAYCSAL